MCPSCWRRGAPTGLDWLSLGCDHRCANKLSRSSGSQGKSSRTASDEGWTYQTVEKVEVLRAGNRPCLIAAFRANPLMG